MMTESTAVVLPIMVVLPRLTEDTEALPTMEVPRHLDTEVAATVSHNMALLVVPMATVITVPLSRATGARGGRTVVDMDRMITMA